MNKCNQNVRLALQLYNVKQWELAEALGMAETTLCRKLRTELSPELAETMISLIKKLSAKSAEGR